MMIPVGWFIAGCGASACLGFLLASALAVAARADRVDRELLEELEQRLFGSGPRPPRPHPSEPFKKG